MIKVLHIIEKMDRAGAETMLMNLYRQIDHIQVQFDFIVFTNEPGDYDEEIIRLGGRIIPIVAQNAFLRMIKLYQFLRHHPEYKIIHAHVLLNNAFQLLAAKYAGVEHRISHSHSTSNGKYGIIEKIYEKWSIKINKTLATYKIACGQEAGEYLFGKNSNVKILPNSINLQQIAQVAKKNKNYITQEFNAQSLKIIQVGRLQSVKNHMFSLQVAEHLKNKGVKFHLYFIGQGGLEEELKKQVNIKLLSNHVEFLGVRSDIPQLMAGADCMLMPSLHEGFPVVLVESQAVGLPTLVSDQIAKEVDLQVGLVKFLSIDSTQIWVDSLLNLSFQKYSEQKRLEKLKNQGFDVVDNACFLTKLYSEMKFPQPMAF